MQENYDCFHGIFFPSPFVYLGGSSSSHGDYEINCALMLMARG